MTITVSKPYEAGKTYRMSVLFADKNGRYLNVRDDGNAGFATTVEGRAPSRPYGTDGTEPIPPNCTGDAEGETV